MKYFNSLPFYFFALCILGTHLQASASTDPDWEAFVKNYGRYVEKKLKVKNQEKLVFLKKKLEK